MGQRIKCRKCGDTIESKSRHDFVYCQCHSIFIDGGNDYCRYGGDLEAIEFIKKEKKDVRTQNYLDALEILKKRLKTETKDRKGLLKEIRFLMEKLNV